MVTTDKISRPTLYLTTRKQWRQWLAKYHKSVKEIWLVYYRKEISKPSLPYEDSVEEALCYGWIDSIVKKLDSDSYARKFTPRTNMKNWSATNKRRMAKMLKSGKVTKAGLATIEGIDLKTIASPAPRKKPSPLVVPDYIIKAFKHDKKVWDNFNAMTKSNQRCFVMWISTAKKDETRARRIAESIKLLRQNQKLGLK